MLLRGEMFPFIARIKRNLINVSEPHPVNWSLPGESTSGFFLFLQDTALKKVEENFNAENRPVSLKNVCSLNWGGEVRLYRSRFK